MAKGLLNPVFFHYFSFFFAEIGEKYLIAKSLLSTLSETGGSKDEVV